MSKRKPIAKGDRVIGIRNVKGLMSDTDQIRTGQNYTVRDTAKLADNEVLYYVVPEWMMARRDDVSPIIAESWNFRRA